jgi:hypothetical protein
VVATTVCVLLGNSSAIAAGITLRNVHWRSIQVPGVACYRASPIQLHGGQALLPDPIRGNPVDPGGTGPKFDQVIDGFAKVKYGDLERNRPIAAVILSCNNNGGTADGALLYSVVIYEGWAGKLRALGLITPRIQSAQELPTLLEVRSIGRSDVVVAEAFYGPHDGTCCPSGEAVTTWHFSSDRLTVMSTRVVHRPSTRTNV